MMGKLTPPSPETLPEELESFVLAVPDPAVLLLLTAIVPEGNNSRWVSLTMVPIRFPPLPLACLVRFLNTRLFCS